MHIHNNTGDTAPLSASERVIRPPRPRASERPTLVWAMGSERGFQEKSSGLRAGGPQWGSPPVHVSEANNGCPLVITWFLGKPKEEIASRIQLSFCRGALCLCVCGIWPTAPLKASLAHFLFFFSCFPHSSDTLDSPGSRVSSKALTLSKWNVWAGYS